MSGCDNDGFRSLNTKKIEESGLRVSVNSKKAALCKDHYKEWKKETRDDRSLERADLIYIKKYLFRIYLS